MLEKIKHLDIKIIAPSHGYIIRENVEEFIDLYKDLSREAGIEKKAAIIYSSMTGNTKKIAKMLKDGFELDGIITELLDLNKTEEEIIIKAVKDADLVLMGSSTKYADMTGKTEDIIKKIIELDLTGKTAGAFGSYGWSGEGIEVLQDYLLKSNMDVLNSSSIIKNTAVNDVQCPLRFRFLPEDETKLIIDRATNYISGIMLNAS